MFEIGRVCIKIAGRDSRKKCAVIEILDDKFVVIDGETRRRKCNVKHLEPLDQVIDINSGNSDDVCKALDVKVIETKPKQKTEKSKRFKKVKSKVEKVVKKKTAKKK